MIAFFPSFYPDELLYSTLARYCAKAGYLKYQHISSDLYLQNNIKPNVEFVNKFNRDAYNVITKNISFEEIIMKHTMFPYYVRFLPKEERHKALKEILIMSEAFYNTLPMPKKQMKRPLRYCPLCAKKDRELYSETYWHRNHQLIGINKCKEHNCQLVNTEIMISSKASPTFVTAEEIIPITEEPVFINNKTEERLVQFVTELFQSEVNMDNDVLVGDFLHSKMEGTKYLSSRGEMRNISLIHSDFVEYYKDVNYPYFKELWQIQKVFTNDRLNPFEICMLAMFLNVTVEELTDMKLPEKSQYELFDEQVHELHKQGLNYCQIAEKLNASYDFVKSIGRSRKS